MNEKDSLHSVLREWEAPEPPAALDVRVREAYRGRQQKSVWRSLWSARISVPVPVFAALVLVAVAFWIGLRPHPAPPAQATPGGYVTRMESAGFQPLPNGAIRVIRAGEIKQ